MLLFMIFMSTWNQAPPTTPTIHTHAHTHIYLISLHCVSITGPLQRIRKVNWACSQQMQPVDGGEWRGGDRGGERTEERESRSTGMLQFWEQGLHGKICHWKNRWSVKKGFKWLEFKITKAERICEVKTVKMRLSITDGVMAEPLKKSTSLCLL